MVIGRGRMGPAGRWVAWILAAVCIAAGAVGLVLGVRRSHGLMAVAGAAVIGLGVLYAVAARRGRPLG
jgi:hypothetical protein